MNTLAKTKDDIRNIKRNSVEIRIIRKNQFRVLRSLNLQNNGLLCQFFQDSKPLCGCFLYWYITWLLFSLRRLAKSEFPRRTLNKMCHNFLQLTHLNVNSFL